MRSTRNNRIKKLILSFFFLFLILAPVSLSITTQNSLDTSVPKLQITLIAHETYAGSDDSWLLGDVGASIGRWAGYAFLTLASAVTWFGGTLLEFVTNSLVFGMGDWLAKGSGLGKAIDNTWEVLRDICNLLFIFGFIYTGINTILNPESAETKRFVARIIIAALLINFSLFFVKIIIDFSNYAAYQIYVSMVQGSGTLSAKIADTLGIITIFDNPSPEMLAKSMAGQGFWFFIMAALFLLTAAFVFIGAAFLLMSRFVTLIYIMVASPILFAATIFPQTEEYASKLWHKLISAAFFAPAYFLLTLISLRLLQGINLRGAGQGGSFTNAFDPMKVAGNSGSFEIILFFVLAIFFLISSLTIAHSMGIKGSEMVIKKTKGAIGASTAGLAAKVFRTVGGQGFNSLAESDRLKDAATQSGVTGWGARQVLKGSRVVADSSLDIRKVAGVGNTMGIGEGRKGGYVSALKEVKEKEEKFAKSLGELDDTDVRVRQRKEEEKVAKKAVEQSKEDLEKLKKTRDRAAAAGASKDDIAYHDKLIADQKENIHHAEEDVEKAKIKIEQEKMRRQIGSTFVRPTGANAADVTQKIKADEDSVKRYKKQVENSMNKFMEDLSSLSTEEAETRRETIQYHIDAYEKAKKEQEEYLIKNLDSGYAGVLQNSSRIASWLEGRSASQNRKAGKEIRKARKKGKPHESDSHGGGHAPAHTPAPAAGGGAPAAGGHAH